MKISKFKLAWKFLTGGREGVLDYCLDVANSFTGRLSDAKREDLKSYLAAARNILGMLGAVSRLCPSKWRQAYALTLSAFADLVSVLDDLKVTKEELTSVCVNFRLAYAEWRAE